MNFIRRILITSVGTFTLFFSLLSVADNIDPKVKQAISEGVKNINAGFTVGTISGTEMANMYKVQVENGPKIYMTADAKHFFSGTLFKLDGQQLINVTEQDAATDRLSLMTQLVDKEMIVFAPQTPVKTKTHINVYTDVDCFYCQKLHKEVPELNARGIEVRYAAFPRAGVGSESFNKIVSAWCADDQQTAMTQLKNREEIPSKTCDNAVTKQYELGKTMGITGTPAIILEDGTLIPGYRPAADLAKMLGI